MRFSERKGYKEILKLIQIENVSEELRNSIWNVLYTFFWSSADFQPNYETVSPYDDKQLGKRTIGNYSFSLWLRYFKKPVDSRPEASHRTFEIIRDYFFECKWYEFYDFIEFTLNYYDDEKCNEAVNNWLEAEVSGYRFVSGQITDITDKQEIEMLENALTDEDFPNVKAHLQRALELLSDRKNPDYRNSIKESISAVESIAKEIAKRPKAELAEALKEIEKNGELHGALKKGFLSLYGYTSDANGIRHSLMEESNLTADDAKFFLLVCTSFINYLKTKI
jgi:hypothetical protein